jgi:hypothetical protein
MAAWQPIMTPLKIIIVFICAGVCFIPTGTSIWQSSNNVSALPCLFTCLRCTEPIPHATFDPTHCALLAQVFEKQIYYDNGGGPSGNVCMITQKNQMRQCTVTFTIDQAVTGPLLVYYQLDNYHQNHRIYVNSRSTGQLQGQVRDERATA